MYIMIITAQNYTYQMVNTVSFTHSLLASRVQTTYRQQKQKVTRFREIQLLMDESLYGKRPIIKNVQLQFKKSLNSILTRQRIWYTYTYNYYVQSPSPTRCVQSKSRLRKKKRFTRTRLIYFTVAPAVCCNRRLDGYFADDNILTYEVLCQ